MDEFRQKRRLDFQICGELAQRKVRIKIFPALQLLFQKNSEATDSIQIFHKLDQG